MQKKSQFVVKIICFLVRWRISPNDRDGLIPSTTWAVGAFHRLCKIRSDGKQYSFD